ncbi:hypothetical protein [Falsiroseomonas sp. E2-1-a20]|uniref:hypothetical protein n=1 Tax=Falsiroseomonas sp. E2-1-a20 TaxID=3239300 RepID=UPI003F2E5AC0
MLRGLSGAAGLALALLVAAPVLAQDRVGVRVGDHPGFGRVVFDWPATVDYRVEESEGRIVLHFASPAAFDLAAARRPVRNLRGLTSDGARAEITTAPGTRLRHFRLGNRVVLDLLDARRDTPAASARPAQNVAPPAGSVAPAARPAPAGNAPFQRAVPPPAEAPVIVQAAPREPVSVQPLAPPAPSPVPAPVTSPAATPGLAIRLLPGPTLSIPAGAETGAALFRRGGLWMLVLDQPQPLDLTALRADPTFANAETSSGPQATTLRLPAAALPNPRLRREGQAWLLDQPAGEVALRAILPEVEPGPPIRLVLRATRGLGSVSVLDPETGTSLLVGTVRDGAEAVPAGRRAAIFELLPTRLGAALLPRADTVTLRVLEGRFVAGAAPGAELALGPETPGAAAAAASMTRIFDLPAESLTALQERARGATAAVAASPPLGRGPPRLQAAEALLALGLPQEAQAMVGLATREDPALAETPRARALAGATALLSGRLAEAGGLDHPRLPENDEVALWRGLLAAARGQDGAAAVAAGLPLLLAYPEPLQARLAPLAAEALAAGGEPAAARRLLAARDQEDPPLALARARILEAEGATAPALAAYDALAAGRDRRARAIAMRRAAELRLATGLIDAAGAAAALEATLAAWRGDALETEGRSRLAELRQQAGDWRGAFDLLRETAAIFPDLAPGLRERQVAALLGALDKAPPLEAVVLYDAHAEMLPPGEASERALGSLADRLAALDLLDRASHVLRGAIARAPDAEARGRIGARLAGLGLAAGDHPAALAALADTAGEGLSPDLTRQRHLLEARALARAGRVPEAVARYRAAGPAAAAELATLLEEKQDWPGAAAALRQHLDAVAPPPPAPLLAEHQPLVARLAALLTLAGDDSALAALRAEEQGRMGGTLSDAFTLLTADRVAGLSDLPRLGRELDVARGLPSRLDGFRSETPVTR